MNSLKMDDIDQEQRAREKTLSPTKPHCVNGQREGKAYQRVNTHGKNVEPKGVAAPNHSGQPKEQRAGGATCPLCRERKKISKALTNGLVGGEGEAVVHVSKEIR